MSVLDDLQAAMDIMFGLREPHARVKTFTNLMDLYKHYTGDSDATGIFNPRKLPPELRGNMDINSSTFPVALANTLNRALSAGYNKINYFENILISQKSPAKYLHEGEFISLGCWHSLPDIDLEAENYPDMPNITEAGDSFDMLQKGCLIPISRRVIINNDIDLLKKLMERLGLVARKTHARYVWEMYIDNINSNDGTPWFSTTHGNLGSDAIGFSEVAAAITTLSTMIEPGPSGDKVGLDLSNFKWHLIVPVSKWTEAVKVNQIRSYYTANDLSTQTVNPCFHLFGEKNERIATPPFLADSNEWGIVRDPEEVPIIEMEYLDGKEEPEIIFHGDQTSEMAFKGGWFALEALHEYGGKISDHRSSYKSIP